MTGHTQENLRLWCAILQPTGFWEELSTETGLPDYEVRSIVGDLNEGNAVDPFLEDRIKRAAASIYAVRGALVVNFDRKG